MATTLKLTFSTANGNATLSFPNADPDAEAGDVQTLMETIVTNGAAYTTPPTGIVSAAFVINTTIPIAVE